MGRVKNASRNIAFGYLGTIATAVMSFILRTIFIRYLSEHLLGVNTLYTDILSLLSMAELGIGTALNFSLYKPVAEGDTETIKSYMRMYRRAYHTIAAVVAVLGLLLVPFLQHIVRNPGSIALRDLRLYYFIFLFNTVTSYFVAYKYSLVNAEQKNYIQTNILTITKVVSVFCQIIVLLVTKNFYAYLLTDAAVQLLQKIFVSRYLDWRYPYLNDKNVTPLSKEAAGEVWSKTKALIMHKVGDVARLQTDTLIISAMIEVKIAGFVSNYTLVISTISNFANIIFNSVISSFGNLIATESKEKQYEIFKVYRFLAQWVYGFTFTGFFLLLTPLIRLWLGDAWVLPASAISLLLIDYYFKGDRIVLSNFKTAAGVFEEDKYLALLQGVVNLVISIALVRVMGLPGIYVGTIVSGLIANVTKPFIIYRTCFDRGAGSYFKDSALYLVVLVFILAVSYGAMQVLPQGGVVSFFAAAVMITVIFHVIFFAFFGRTAEFQYLWEKVSQRGRVH